MMREKSKVEMMREKSKVKMMREERRVEEKSRRENKGE